MRSREKDTAGSAGIGPLLKEANRLIFYDLIKDRNVRIAFGKFNESQVSSSSFMAISIMVTIAAGIYAARYRRFLHNPHTRTEYITASVMSALHLFLIILLWTIAFLKFRKESNGDNWLFSKLKRFQPTMHIVLPVGMSCYFGLQLILRVMGGQCPPEYVYMDVLMCNPNHSTNGLPEETLAQLMLLPIVFHIILRDSMIGTFIVTWLLSVGSVILAGTLMSIKQTMPFIVVYLCYSLLILYDNQRQNLSLFFLAEKLKFALGENERMADETHASELRHMIANVAHDLKTVRKLRELIEMVSFDSPFIVCKCCESSSICDESDMSPTFCADCGSCYLQPLSSFLSGIEFISQIVVDWDERLSDPSKAADALNNLTYSSDNLTAIHGCLDSIRNTNSFMIMTINRCIDFTKASKGLKLIPKLETIELQETVDLPIKVMRDFKSNLAINLLPIAADICSHIISDKQWLQENLLCLMSNAVKYSSKGTVEISVMLAKMPIVQRAKAPPKRPSKVEKRSGQYGRVKVSPAAGDGGEHSVSIHSKGSEGGGGAAGEVMPEPDSTKMRRLSNFVFNHAYSSIGKSKVFSDLEKEKDHDAEQDAHYTSIEEGGTGEEDAASESAETNTAASSEGGLFLRIEVEDTGIGLSDEAKLTLFSPFKQAQRLAGGTGLGLYSLAKRIEALNGHYGVSNRRDGNPGSLFWFAIPYRPDETFAQIIQQKNHRHLQRGSSIKAFMNHTGRSLAARGGNATGRHPPVAGELIDLESAPPLNSRSMSNNSVHTDPAGAVTSPTAARPSSRQSSHSNSMSMGDIPDAISANPKIEAPKLCILLVDDTLSILKMTTMMLKRGGHKVEQADNGAVALDLILQGYARNKKQYGAKCADSPYDVVLMDLQMPVMDGLEAVRRLRASEKSILRPVDGPEVNIEDANTVRSFFFGRGSTKKVLSTDSEEAAAAASASSPRVGERRRSSIVCKHQLVIGVSANSDNDTMVEAMKSGFDAFIGKPFSIDAFYEVLQTHQDKVKERKK
jgi:signal transduction histidine kinase/CheY-like chemotaxis protein